MLDIKRWISREFTKRGHSLEEALLVQPSKICVPGLCRIFETHAMGSGCIRHKVWKVLQKHQNEIVRMLRFDTELPKGLHREVSQIQGHDHACAAVNRGCQDVPIIPIRQLNRVDEMLVSRHQRIGQRLVHQLPGTVQFVGCEVGPILEEIAYPFVMNFVGPMSAENTRQCEVHEEVPKPRRVENICVVKGPEYCHESDPDLLVVGDQFAKSREAFRMDSPFVGHYGLETHPTMRSNLPVFDLAFVQ